MIGYPQLLPVVVRYEWGLILNLYKLVVILSARGSRIGFINEFSVYF
jgi:hypothetical protein